MNLKNFNVVQPQEQPKEEVNSAIKMANISIRVDANCFLLCDGEFTEIELQAGKITKVQLPIGQHLLEFIDSEYPELKMEKVVDWPDEGKSYLVLVNEFKKVVDALKAKAEAERKAKAEAERKAKAEAERKAKAEAERKAKEEAERKAKEEAECKAKEKAERKAKAEAERKAKEEAERKKPIKYKVEDCIYELYPTKYTATLIKSTENSVVVLEKISYLDNDYSVTAIGNSAFKNCSSLERVYIRDGVMSIGEEAFYNCDSLTNIAIPDSVTSIGERAFCGCSSLEGTISFGLLLGSIHIPNSVKSIGAEAFYGCDTIKTIYYDGTKAQWKKISLGEDWNNSVPAKVIHCTDGDVEI